MILSSLITGKSLNDSYSLSVNTRPWAESNDDGTQAQAVAAEDAKRLERFEDNTGCLELACNPKQYHA